MSQPTPVALAEAWTERVRRTGATYVSAVEGHALFKPEYIETILAERTAAFRWVTYWRRQAGG